MFTEEPDCVTEVLAGQVADRTIRGQASRHDCLVCGTDLDSADAEHEANMLEMQVAQALRKALAALN